MNHGAAGGSPSSCSANGAGAYAPPCALTMRSASGPRSALRFRRVHDRGRAKLPESARYLARNKVNAYGAKAPLLDWAARIPPRQRDGRPEPLPNTSYPAAVISPAIHCGG